LPGADLERAAEIFSTKHRRPFLDAERFYVAITACDQQHQSKD
jgi:hypothetical protein